ANRGTRADQPVWTDGVPDRARSRAGNCWSTARLTWSPGRPTRRVVASFQACPSGSTIGHLAGFQAIDHHAFDCDAAAGGGDAEECPFVRSGPGKAAEYLVALCDHFIDRPMDIGKGGA